MTGEGTGNRSQRRKLLDAAGLWEYALRLLRARALPVAELRDKLRLKAADPSEVAPLVDKLKSYGLLDDEKYAESYAAARLESRSQGRLRVLRDLRQRRIPARVAREAVEKVYGEADEARLIEEFLQKKYRRVALAEHLADPRNLAAAYRKLRYAGFSARGAIEALKRYSAQAGELEGELPEES
jgi:regulatory protein